MAKLNVPHLKNIPETLLIPLYYKSLLTKERHPVITDNDSVKIVAGIDYDFTKFNANKATLTGVASRTIIFDMIVKEWLSDHPKGIIVNIGAGLDTRPLRFPDARWYNIDLPESIEVREKFITSGETNIAKSAFDFTWMDIIPEKENVLFICEAVLFFFSENDVRSLFQAIAANFTNSQFAFETAPHFAVKRMKVNNNPLKWSNQNLSDVTKWSPKLKPLATYSLIDYARKKWSLFFRLLVKLMPQLRKGYKIGVISIK